MKPLKYVLTFLIIICLTIVFLNAINNGRLCEVNLRLGDKEVAAKLACAI